MNRALNCLGFGLSVGLAFSGCETPGQSAVAGAAAGAVVGGARGNDRDVLRGAAIGAAGGYALGKLAESDRRRSVGGPYPYPASPVVHGRVYAIPSLPYGRPSGRHGFVFSPYSRRLVDVRGIPHGAEVVDPFSGQMFRNP